VHEFQMAEGTGMLMVDDVNMYIPFLHPSVVSRVNAVRRVGSVSM